MHLLILTEKVHYTFRQECQIMKEILIIIAGISAAAFVLAGIQGLQEVAAMNAEIKQAHAKGALPCPPPSPRDENGNLIGPTPAQIQAERQATEYGE